MAEVLATIILTAVVGLVLRACLLRAGGTVEIRIADTLTEFGLPGSHSRLSVSNHLATTGQGRRMRIVEVGHTGENGAFQMNANATDVASHDLSTAFLTDPDLARTLWQAFVHYCKTRALRGATATERLSLIARTFSRCIVHLDINDTPLRESVEGAIRADKTLRGAGLQVSSRAV